MEGRLTDDDPTLDDGSHYDWYALQGSAGQTVSLRLSSADVDAYLVLLDGAGGLVAEDDDSGGGTDAFLQATLPSDGVYVVVANTALPGETGRYTLAWESSGAEGPGSLGTQVGEGAGEEASSDGGPRVDGSLVPGEILSGTVGAAPEHYRTYTLDVPQGVASVVLTLQAKTDLDLFARFGQQMLDWETDSDHAAVTPDSLEEIVISAWGEPALRAGRYYIDVANLVDGAPGGAFTLHTAFRASNDASAPTVTAPPQEQVEGALTAGVRLQGRLGERDLVRYWAVEAPPGARRLEVGLFEAEGPLDLVVAPEGAVPVALDAYPHAVMSALDNERLVLPLGEDRPARWWVGVVNWEPAPVDYEIEARFDEPLPPHPTFQPAGEPEQALTPLQRAIAATVQISTSQGTGSGSLVSPDGLVLTNYHVVATCETSGPAFACQGEPLREAGGVPERVVVGLSDSERGAAVQSFYARLQETLPEYDLALLRIETDLNGDTPAGPLPWVPLDLGPVSLGDEVVVIGYPGIARTLGRYPLSLTRGIVSGFTTDRGRRVLIQTDATVNAGNSGGLMIRARDGVLIGVPSDVRYDTELLEKQNYARPVALLPDEWRRLIEAGGGSIIGP
ncbi:trypsin-like peptidase domain-containing protein [Limnochorda pilosa]|uniref:Peptidase C-terminal archaeal/bacterial domain-containing protein n=1 Tax=Limnochorda pilosa TaxID=1555112 RepID=A0A0K2SQN9_LIMPI|nr:trypsin-like peptidase domain-containing protein [Limnochorda pilosa]BAS29312.1 hypothetical protein LIP_3500 [Limnochorda pilosa]